MANRMNLMNIAERCNYGVLVTMENVRIGKRVCEGQHWNKKWRDNIDPASGWAPGVKKKRVPGTVIGYYGVEGFVGENATRKYNKFESVQKGWCAVRWDNDKSSVYPIGDMGIFSLAYYNI